jgi:hypothetical protein
METPCESRYGEKVSRLIISGKDAMPSLHDDLLASPTGWPLVFFTDPEMLPLSTSWN